jgi:hypothetical protein
MDRIFQRRLQIRDQLQAWKMPPDPDTALALLVIAVECLMVAEGKDEIPGPLSKEGIEWLMGVTMRLATGGAVHVESTVIRLDDPAPGN